MRQKITVSWSGGKDSAFALHKILPSTTTNLEVVSLHTVIDETTRRVGLHGVSETLIERQAQEIGLPLEKLYVSASKDDGDYTRRLKKFYRQCVEDGIHGVAFGDIHLQDLKEYRINLLKPFDLFAIFPLWGLDSNSILKEFIAAGFKARICAANANLFSVHQLGGILDYHFADTIQPEIDPCGENGEFHTFVYDGPIFKKEICVTTGEVVRRSYQYQILNTKSEIENVETAFWFQELHV